MKIIKNRDIQCSKVVKIFKNQIFEEIVYDAKFNGQKFIDPEYSPDNKNIFYSKKFELNIPWNRPSDLTRRPCLIKEGPKCCTNMIIRESKMKNFISVCGALSRNMSYLDEIIPNLEEQKSRYNENSENDPGAFHFFFWKFGTIWDVTIDDLLPMSISDKKPLYSYAEDYSEFWVSLLEKAVTKFNHGDYESLKNRTIGEILVDLTSGVYELITDIQKDKSLELFEKLNRSLISKDLIIFNFTEFDCIEGKNSVKRYIDDADNGYTLTEILNFQVKQDHEKFFDKKDYCLLKFFSPWRYFNYDGPWSSSSKEWQSLMNNIREEYGLALDTSCEFLMPFDYAIEYFTNIHILHSPESLFYEGNEENKIIKTPTYGICYKRKWIVDNFKGLDKNRAGKPCPELFLCHSQYRFDVKNPQSTVIKFSLQQEKLRYKGEFDDKNLKTVIFLLFKIEDNRKYRCHMQYQNIVIKINLGSSRDVYYQFEPKQSGRYLLLPCNEKTQYSVEYLLRVFSNENINFRELKYDTPNEIFPHNTLSCLRYNLGTIVVLHEINFNALDDIGKFDEETSILVEMTCEQERYSKIVRATSSNIIFEKNLSLVFYRKLFSKPILVNIQLIKNKKETKEKLGFFRIQNVESDEINQVYMLNSFNKIKKNKKTKMKSFISNANALVSVYNRETLMKI